MTERLFSYPRSRSCNIKKQRGVLRKAHAILREAQDHKVELDQAHYSWFDHVHLDWYGIGNKGSRIRRITMEAHALLFCSYARECHVLGKPFQLFLCFPMDDGGSDAVYFHTACADSDFPFEIDGITWNEGKAEALRQTLMKLIPHYTMTVGIENSNYIAFAEGIGIPLRPTESV